MIDIKELKKKAVTGDLRVTQTIANMYELGDGVEQNYEEAAKWWLYAFTLGDQSAIDLWRGCMLMAGKSVKESMIPDPEPLKREMLELLQEMHDDMQKE